MKSLDKVREAGYNVAIFRNQYGVLSITISGGGAWTRIVIKPWSDVRLMVGELVRRCKAYIANPLNEMAGTV